MCRLNPLYSFYLFIFFKSVTGPPEDDPKWRWRRGGGKNFPVKVTLKLQENQAQEVKRKLELCGLAVMTRMMSHEKDD